LTISTIEPHIPQKFRDSVLEGTLLKDFYEDCRALSPARRDAPYSGTSSIISDDGSDRVVHADRRRIGCHRLLGRRPLGSHEEQEQSGKIFEKPAW
jgi:hypothetical protein